MRKIFSAINNRRKIFLPVINSAIFALFVAVPRLVLGWHDSVAVGLVAPFCLLVWGLVSASSVEFLKTTLIFAAVFILLGLPMSFVFGFPSPNPAYGLWFMYLIFHYVIMSAVAWGVAFFLTWIVESYRYVKEEN
ncbi:MAG: hypothetical protein FWC70_06065 [Defluviitaleaceae bacterium]|nr:hypothetical protein [Defluviitaleaceae bacterium]